MTGVVVEFINNFLDDFLIGKRGYISQLVFISCICCNAS